MTTVTRRSAQKSASSKTERETAPGRRPRRKPVLPETAEVGAAADQPAKQVRAKLFQNGRSQAVRLPKEFRFEGKEVQVSRQGDSILLSPVEKRTRQEYWDDYFKALEPYRDLPFPDCEDTTVTEPEDIFAEGWV